MELDRGAGVDADIIYPPPEVPEPGRDGRFLDEGFLPCDASLGFPADKRRSFIGEAERHATRWLRLPDMLRANGVLAESAPAILWRQIRPEAITQGQVGNCWLIAAIAALAEFPQAVQELFVESDIQRGRYVIRLFDMSKARWELVTIDDYIPCVFREDKASIPHMVDKNLDRIFRWEDLHFADGTKKPVPRKWVPHFAQPGGEGMWPILLEKAMAKFVGSYAFISGGAESFAMMSLTGMPLVFNFVRDAQMFGATKGQWQWCASQYVSRSVTAVPYSHIRGDMPALADDQLWSRLQLYHLRNYMMTVSITNYEQPTSYRGFFRRDGLVLGHAYTLLDLQTATVSGDAREAVSWIDQDGDEVGFERVADCMYAVVNGSRWQPAGVQDTVHIAELRVSKDREQYAARDTMGTAFTGVCPADKCDTVLRMWAARKAPSVASEPHVLNEGTRVRFCGLKKNPELNGRLGEILGVASPETADSPAQYRVKLIIDIGHYDVGTLADEYSYWEAVAKRTNLEVAPGVPGARGGAVRLVLLRNPHGEGVLVTHEDGTQSHCTKWRGDWCDDSPLWDLHQEVARQMGYNPANDGRFWMSWEDFRRTFDKVCVATKSLEAPTSAKVHEMPAEFCREEPLPISLAKMASMEEIEARTYQPAPFLRSQLKLACIKFDPFDAFPGFLDDGTLDTRLRWEASKPGRLMQFLNQVVPQQADAVRRRVHELGLEVALSPCGHT